MTTTILVNDVPIAAEAIAAELQHHPADSTEAAWNAAAEALIVREVLLQEARQRGVLPAPRVDGAGRRELEEEATIRALLEVAIDAAAPTEEECRRFFEANPDRFRSPDLFEASHILLAASREDRKRYAEAVATAERIISTLSDAPELLPKLARELSDCSSASSGGHLGQIGRGDTAPEVETFLYNLEEDQLCPVPVKTRFGAHVLYLHKRMLGAALPYEAVGERIERYLAERAWRDALAAFIARLLNAAEICRSSEDPMSA